MASLRVLLRRLFGRSGRDQWEADLDDELRFHLQMETERHMARGLSPDEARRQAYRELGGIDVTKDAYRDQKSLPFLEMLVQDVRYALRVLAKERAFTAVAVLTLALGIGANTAIFSVVNGVLLDPLPYDGSDRIVTIWQNFSAQGGPEREWIEIPNFVEFKGETQLFDKLVVYGGGVANLTGRGEPRRLNLLAASEGFFGTFAVTPALGRDFTADDDVPGAAPVVIISHGLWQREFAGQADAIGQTLQLSGRLATIVGVAPADFDPPIAPGTDLFVPARIDFARATRGNFSWQGLARLKAGVSVAQAEGRLTTMMERIGEEFPDDRGVTISIIPLLDQLVTPVRAALWVLQGVVLLVLLIACANIANLMLSRSAARGREMAVRTALGAGRRRLVRQLLTESLVLSMAGAMLGLLLAVWGTGALKAAIPSAAPRIDNISIDATVLVFTIGLALGAGLLFGLAPVAHAFRHDVARALKYGGRESQDAGTGGRLRSALATGQIALALCLLIAAGLTTRSFIALMRVDPGFTPDGLTTAFVSMPPDNFAGGPELVGFLDRLVTRIGSNPGIESVGAVSVLPLSGSDSDTSFAIEGRPELNAPGREPVVWYRRVTPDYFQTMGVPVVRGREFTDADRMNAPPVVMISDVAADRYWPGEDAIGKRIRFGDGEWHTIVGITRGVRAIGLSQPPRPELYFPFTQRPGRAMTVVVKSPIDEAAVAAMLRADLQELAPNVPLSNVVTMSSLMASSAAPPRFLMRLTAAFGLLALTLAAVGIYGVMAYSVSLRTAEMGLRMALGAGRRRVLTLIVSRGLLLTAAGIAAGLLVSWWATSAMAAVLFDVNVRDVVTFAGAPLVLALVALAACLVPAYKATRIDPMRALRED